MNNPAASSCDLKRCFDGNFISKVKRTHVFFALLVIHQTAISLVRFSRVTQVSNSNSSGSSEALNNDSAKTTPVYNAATAIFLTECLKGVICWVILVVEISSLPLASGGQEGTSKGSQPSRSPLECGLIGITSVIAPKQRSHLLNMVLPGLLYTVQNNLLYIALSNLDTPTFLVTSQLKIISTAIFSVILFKKHLSSLQWISLVLLTLGVSFVQLQPKLSTKPSYSQPGVEQDWFKGLIAIIFSCLSSGLAGCWFEMLVKKPETISKKKKDEVVATVSDNPLQIPLHEKQRAETVTSLDPLSDSLWVKNLQLSLFTIPFAFMAIYLDPRSHHEVITRGFFSGYGPLVWSVIIYHAVGGILVSLIVKQTSTMAKSFANSLSIVVSTLLSSCLSGVLPGYRYLIGTALVVISTRIYSSTPVTFSDTNVSHNKKLD